MDKKNKAQDHLKPPFHAYKGDDPYIFVSYAHVDAKRVFPELIRFHNQGYNIWFDQGISPGNEWPEEIEAALLKSSLFVVFLSESSVKSYNVRNEINLAIDEGIPFISIYLEDTELKYGLRLRLSSIQGILKYSTPEEEYVSKYISAFKREGIVPSKKSKIEIIDDMDEILIPEDKDKYVFASYDKRDEELVLPELKKLRMQGLDIKCINFENEWSEDTEQKILESSLFLVFITSNSINSLIVRDEISLAHLEDIPFIAIYLEEVELKYGLKLQMASKESIYKYDMDEEEYVQRYTNSFMRHGFKLTDLDTFKTTGEKYIYASFDVKDKYDALSQIEEFTSSGLNIEYDLSDGENEENIDKLLNASLYLVFITPNSIRSNIVRDEIYLALSEDIPFIAIYLSETKITTGLKRQLDSKLTIFKYMLDENHYVKSYTDAFKKYGFQLIDKAPGSSRVKKPDERLNNEYLKEFDKLNTTTESIFELDNHKVLIILKDGTNLTNWDDVKNKEDIIYISEDLSDYTNLSGKYDGLKSLKAIITPKVAEKFTTLKFMFNGCESLVDISSLNNWNISKVINFNSMFKGCSSLVDLSPLNGWDVSRVTNFNSMFEGCSSLADLSHLNNWNISQKSNVRMEHTFDTGNSLKEYPKWYEKNKSRKSTTQNKKPLKVPSSKEEEKTPPKKDKIADERLTSEYLKEFEKLNTTTESIFELGEHKVLIILKDGTNLTRWEDVKDKDHISYISEDLSDCTSLKEKYARFSSLKAIVTSDISDKVTSLFRMFEDCLSLKDITGLQNWNTKNITDMNKMFEGCSSLTDITPLQNWKTNNVIDMNAMFFRCSSLTDITPLQNWKTNKVNNMRFMFCGCLSLTDITPLQNWKTNNVIDMSWMFEGCSSLTDITLLQNWKTNNVMDMRSMFERCSSLVDLSPLSNWNTSKADKTGIFKDCSSIETYPSWDERSKSKKDKTNDKRLTSEYLKEFEKLNTTTESIFELGEHKVLIILKDGTNLTDWDDVKDKKDIVYISEDLSDYNSLEEKYGGLSSLKAIVTSDISDKVTSLFFMFKDCSSLKDITSLKNWKTNNVTNMMGMFSGCSSLTDIRSLENWNTGNVTDMSIMFEDCSSLLDLSPLSNWKTSQQLDKTFIFRDCSSLKIYPSWYTDIDSVYDSLSEKFQEFGIQHYEKPSDIPKIERFMESIEEEYAVLKQNCSDESHFQLLSDEIAYKVKGTYISIINEADSFDEFDLDKISKVFRVLIDIAYTVSTKTEIENNLKQLEEIKITQIKSKIHIRISSFSDDVENQTVYSAKRYSHEIQSELDKLDSQYKNDLSDIFALSLDAFFANQMAKYGTEPDKILKIKDELEELLITAKRFAKSSETKEKIDNDKELFDNHLKFATSLNNSKENEKDKNIFGKIKKIFR